MAVTVPRGPRFRKTAAAGMAYQAAASMYQLLVPAAVSRVFDARVLGLWLTAYSLFGLFLGAGLGVPGTLLSGLDSDGPRREAVNAGLLRSALVLTFGYVAAPLVFAALAPLLPWARWVGTGWPASVGAPGPLLSWLVVLAVASVLAGLAQPIYVGLHRGYQAYAATAAVHLAAIPVLVIAAWLRAPFFVLAALFVAPPLVSGVGLWLWGLSRRWFTVAPRSEPGALAAFWRVGGPFLAMDLVTLLIVRTPEVILSRTQGLVDAGRYSVITRFPFLLNAVLIVVLQPLWPSFAAAARSGDLRQARALVRRAYGATLALWAVFALLVAAAGKVLVRKWLGGDAEGPAALLPFGVALALAQSLHYCSSLVLVGLGARGQNLRVNVVMLIVYVPLAFFLSRAAAAAGIFVALIAVFGVVGAPLTFLTGQRLLRRWAADAPQGGAA